MNIVRNDIRASYRTATGSFQQQGRDETAAPREFIFSQLPPQNGKLEGATDDGSEIRRSPVEVGS